MKYLGDRSLSSWISKALALLVYVVPAGAMALIFILSVMCFSAEVADPTVSNWAEFKYELLNMVKKDKEAWEITRNSPIVVRVFMLIYVLIASVLFFEIIRTSRRIFENFSSNIVFSESNNQILSRLTRFIIAFSVFTFNFSSLLIGIILLILSEILKNGTALQEELDLTV